MAYLSRNEVWGERSTRSSDAVQAYARVWAGYGKRRGQPSPEFSLNARIPTLPNCVQEGEFNLAKNCTSYRRSSEARGVRLAIARISVNPVQGLTSCLPRDTENTSACTALHASSAGPTPRRLPPFGLDHPKRPTSPFRPQLFNSRMTLRSAMDLPSSGHND
jgi:hypothetical protein